MYTALLAVDDSEERAIAQANAVLELPGPPGEVTAHLLHVTDNSDEATESEMTTMPAVVAAQERLREADIDVELMGRAGDAAEEILRGAEEVNANSIILGGRKRSPLGSLLFGSISQAVTLDATRPVMITGTAENTEKPSHECPSCGEMYYTDPGAEIATCRQCGGSKVAAIE